MRNAFLAAVEARIVRERDERMTTSKGSSLPGGYSPSERSVETAKSASKPPASMEVSTKPAVEPKVRVINKPKGSGRKCMDCQDVLATVRSTHGICQKCADARWLKLVTGNKKAK